MSTAIVLVVGLDYGVYGLVLGSFVGGSCVRDNVVEVPHVGVLAEPADACHAYRVRERVAREVMNSNFIF